MRVLVACEFSGVVRDAFLKEGCDAVSCDLLPTESPGPHIQGDVLAVLKNRWDLMVGFPPCTHLALSGARWFEKKQKEQQEALLFFRTLLLAPVPKICLENPMSLAARVASPSQVIHPWMFGHGEVKTTWLWLKGLPWLQPTKIVAGREPRVHYTPPGEDRWKLRSRSYKGVAKAMAAQWGAGKRRAVGFFGE